MTTPEDHPVTPPADEVPPVETERSWSPAVPAEDDTPAWADADAFAETADEAGYDAWAQEQDLGAPEPAPVETAPVESAPVESAPVEVAPVDASAPEAAPVVATGPEPGAFPGIVPPPVPEVLPPAAPEPAPVFVPEVEPFPEPPSPPAPEPEPEVEPEPEAEPEPEPEQEWAEEDGDAGEGAVDDEWADDEWADEDLEEEPVEALDAGAVDEAPGLAAEAADEEPDGDEPVVPVGGGRSGWFVALSAAVVLLVALGAALGVLALRSAGAGPLQDKREAALDAARTGARLVFSYDYHHLAKDFAAGRAVTTGEFRAEYERTTGKLVEDVAPRYKAVVVADVGAAAVVSASGDRVVALVFVDQQSTSTLAAAPKLTQSRLELTMVRHGGQWLIERIRAF